MKLSKTVVAFTVFVILVTLQACASTLFFPVKPAERAADKVIGDIWPEATKPAAPIEAKKS